MNKSTFRIIIVLVCLLFVNIEAAQAGLVHRIKLFINNEFPPNQFVFLIICASFFIFVAYVVLAPVNIGKEKRAWLDYYRIQPKKRSYQHRRIAVNRISDVLRMSETKNSAHS